MKHLIKFQRSLKSEYWNFFGYLYTDDVYFLKSGA